eukprot:CAMPEP_0170490012 /NCGR_PEP_ID=MMETSP0208-20121228/8295_1 /TAXON_ID=197538 /ORGANISM="Strombidium inclinatum, Strain S3" /LENGTH=57 /DNA_ID=CAMNT_0010765203 /DNA_START=1 /DNA_END=171 /DNA_ORIENTATION=-
MIDLKASTSDKAQYYEVPRDLNETLKFISSLNNKQIEELFFSTKDSSGLRYDMEELF